MCKGDNLCNFIDIRTQAGDLSTVFYAMYKGDNLFLLFYRQDIKTGKLVV